MLRFGLRAHSLNDIKIGTNMRNIVYLTLIMTSLSVNSEEKMTREILCSLEFGRYVDSNESVQVEDKPELIQKFVGSTPIQDACSSTSYGARVDICNFNYKRAEVVTACIRSYDAITHLLATY